LGVVPSLMAVPCDFCFVANFWFQTCSIKDSVLIQNQCATAVFAYAA
jgi:hypothetical protein